MTVYLLSVCGTDILTGIHLRLLDSSVTTEPPSESRKEAYLRKWSPACNDAELEVIELPVTKELKL